jgi:hypothetical protein
MKNSQRHADVYDWGPEIMLEGHEDKQASRLRSIPILQGISLAFCGFGIVVRLTQYFSNRSLWGDEAALALNIVNRSYLELLEPLAHNQAAPPLFLFVEKLWVQLLGNSEVALRLFPLIAGILSLLAFYHLAQRYTSEIAAPVAVGLFASLRHPIYYATEAKQYASDTLVALLLAILLIPLHNRQLDRRQLVGIALAGVLAIWTAYPAVFVLAGIELTYLLVGRERWRTLRNRLPAYLTWLTSFGLLYTVNINRTIGGTGLADAWGERFPSSPLDILWLFDSFGRFFYRPLSFANGMDAVAIAAFIIGCVVCYRRNRVLLGVMLSPAIATLMASYLHKYPFYERLVLFLAPFFLLVIAQGVAFLLEEFRNRKLVAGVGVALLALLLAPPLVRATQLAIAPEFDAEIRPVLAYVNERRNVGDRLYIPPQSQLPFLYYSEKYGYRDGDYILGEDDEPNMSSLQGRSRVWLVVSDFEDEEEIEPIISKFKQSGKKVEGFQQPGAAAYLFRFASPLPTPKIGDYRD